MVFKIPHPEAASYLATKARTQAGSRSWLSYKTMQENVAGAIIRPAILQGLITIIKENRAVIRKKINS